MLISSIDIYRSTWVRLTTNCPCRHNTSSANRVASSKCSPRARSSTQYTNPITRPNHHNTSSLIYADNQFFSHSPVGDVNAAQPDAINGALTGLPICQLTSSPTSLYAVTSACAASKNVRPRNGTSATKNSA